MPITAPLRRFIARLAWSDLMRPRIAWAAMAASALVAGGAIQHSIERLESASQARARLERQSAGLHERFQASPGAPAPALQQIRAQHDEAVASAAAWSRWTVWGSLVWMFGVGGASAWSLQRSARSRHEKEIAAAPAPAGEAPAAAPSLPVATEPGVTQAAPDWQAVRREILAVSELIGPVEAPHTTGSGQVIARVEPVAVDRGSERAVVHRLPGADSLRPDLRLAA